MSETTVVKGQFGLDQSGGTGKKLKYIFITDMSSRYIQPKPSVRQQKLKWMNMIAHCHDIFCDCYTPIEHTAILLFEQEKDLKFKTPEVDLIKKCITGETTAPVATIDEDGIGEGDLDALFQEDFGEEKSTG